MVECLKGENGYAVGGGYYLRVMHDKSFLGKALKDVNRGLYYEALRELAKRTQSVVREVEEDLKKYSKILRYIPQNDRENLIKVIDGLVGVCQMTGSSASHHRDCIRMLNLSDGATKSYSGSNQREIDKIYTLINKGGKSSLSKSERLEIIKKAGDTRNTIRAISRGSKERELYLQEVGFGRNREIFKDAWIKYQYGNNPKKYTGKCGKVICSTEYIEYIEQQVFKMEIPKIFGGRYGNRKYTTYIKDTLKAIAKTIEHDMKKRYDTERVFLTQLCKDELLEAVQSLRTCSISVDHVVEQKVNTLYTFIEYQNEQELEFYARKLNKIKPNVGVVGYGILGEASPAFISLSGQLYFVIDSYGNYGVLRIYGVGLGYGGGLSIQTLELPTVKTIFELESKSLSDYDISVGASYGPFYFGTNSYDGDASDGWALATPFGSETKKTYLKAKELSPELKSLKNLEGLRNIPKNRLRLGIGASAQIQFSKLLYYKKVKR